MINISSFIVKSMPLCSRRIYRHTSLAFGLLFHLTVYGSSHPATESLPQSAPVTYSTALAPGQSIAWNDPAHWIPGGIPGAGDTIMLAEPGAENNVNQGDAGGTVLNSIGNIKLTGNMAGVTGYRFRRGALDFNNNGASTTLTLDGNADATLQFRYDEAGQRILLRNNLEVITENTVGRIDMRGNITSDNIARTIIKKGPGELRFRDTQYTSGYRGNVIVQEGVLRMRNAGLTGLQSDNTITVAAGGQLRLDGQDSPGQNIIYDFGAAVIRISGSGRASAYGGSGGAIRQHTGLGTDSALINNNIELLQSAHIHVNREDDVGSTLALAGRISGAGILYKSGGGTLNLHGSNTSGGLTVENGTVNILAAGALPNAPLRFTERERERRMNIVGSHTVLLLDGDAPDPDEAESANTLYLNLAESGSVLHVVQDIFYDEGGSEDRTRFQGEITGPGRLVKDGDGILGLTRWPKTYSGTTTIKRGVLSVSESAALRNTSAVHVESGGQLRLTSSGTGVSYGFGGVVSLSGFGRGDRVPEGAGLGVLGAMRYEPGSFDNRANLSSDINLKTDTGIHVAGNNELMLSGNITGPGLLSKSGGGYLWLSGRNTHAGDMHVNTGALIIDGNQAGASGNVVVADSAAVGGNGILGGNLRFEAGAHMLFLPGKKLTVGGTVSFGAFSMHNLLGLNNTVADGYYQLIEGDVDVSNLLHYGQSNKLHLGNDRYAFFRDPGLTLIVFTGGGPIPDPDPDPPLGPSIRANGRREHLVINYQAPLVITIAMRAGAYIGELADWWVIAVPLAGPEWYFLHDSLQWVPFPAGEHNLSLCTPAHSGALVDIRDPITILQTSQLPRGVYHVYFAVDPMDGRLNYPEGPILMDMVSVIIE